MTQSEALEILKTGANVFLTGEPGSGKTYTVNQFVKYLREHGIDPAITASTGIAATHIGGMTIHSWSGIGIKENMTQHDLNKYTPESKYSKRILKAQVLIIDEISMLSPRTLAMVDLVCRTVRKISEAFGGMQVVFVGDFFQLPPVVRTESLSRNSDQDPDKSPDRFAFSSPSWKQSDPKICYLTEQHRQDDKAFLDMLGAIRRNEVDEQHFEHIQSRIVQRAAVPIQIPRLFTKNTAVDQLNNERLQKLPGEAYLFTMLESGRKSLVELLKKGCLSPENLYLKSGAVVMFTKNNSQSGFVNGTLGIVRNFNENGFPVVEVRGGRKITVGRMEWQMEQDGKIRASISQLPLRLAWAITVHKSQGVSMDAAAMDLSDVFEYGQGYVALSRVRRLSGLYLFGVNRRTFEVHPEIIQKDSEFRRASEQAENNLSSEDPGHLSQKREKYLISIGGRLEAESAGYSKKKDGADTYQETLALWKDGKTLDQICQSRSLTRGTILFHLETLIEGGKISSQEVSRLITDDLKNGLEQIYNVFDALSDNKLSPVYSQLRGRYSYEQLRIARMYRSLQE